MHSTKNDGKEILLRVTPGLRRQLKILAAERELSMQKLIVGMLEQEVQDSERADFFQREATPSQKARAKPRSAKNQA